VNNYEIQIAEGKIVEVLQRDDRAVFLRVELQRYPGEDGEALQALCRLLVPYHGASHGDWHVPDVGLDVLCFFPGGGHDGAPGGDLGEGYAIGFISSLQEPPVVTGLAGDLSATRRVHLGKPGEDTDVHLQGDLDAEVDGNLDVKIDGAEATESVGTVARVFRALAEWLGDAQMRISAATNLLLHGAVKVEITSDALIDLAAGGAMTLDGATITLTGTTTIEGRVFLNHTHSGVTTGSGDTGGVN
jgi:hypothetical protein